MAALTHYNQQDYIEATQWQKNFSFHQAKNKQFHFENPGLHYMRQQM